MSDIATRLLSCYFGGRIKVCIGDSRKRNVSLPFYDWSRPANWEFASYTRGLCALTRLIPLDTFDETWSLEVEESGLRPFGAVFEDKVARTIAAGVI